MVGKRRKRRSDIEAMGNLHAIQALLVGSNTKRLNKYTEITRRQRSDNVRNHG
jgi:hypothetical protein